MSQNFLFLDIDGPLIPGRCHLHRENRDFLANFCRGKRGRELLKDHPPLFDAWAVRVHNLLSLYCDAKIVIVTNWRTWCGIDDLQSLFASQGLILDYADPPACVKRGLSSTRCQDIAAHLSEVLPDRSRALVIDDEDLSGLNMFYPIEGEKKRKDGDWPRHDDKQVLVVDEKRDIQAKWLDVDFDGGMTHDQFLLGAEFLGIDWDEFDREENPR